MRTALAIAFSVSCHHYKVGLLDLEKLVRDCKDSHQPGEHVVVLADLLHLLLDCVPAPVQDIRELSLLRLRIGIFKLKIALLLYNLLRIPRKHVEMRDATTLLACQLLV